MFDFVPEVKLKYSIMMLDESLESTPSNTKQSITIDHSIVVLSRKLPSTKDDFRIDFGDRDSGADYQSILLESSCQFRDILHEDSEVNNISSFASASGPPTVKNIMICRSFWRPTEQLRERFWFEVLY